MEDGLHPVECRQVLFEEMELVRMRFTAAIGQPHAGWRPLCFKDLRRIIAFNTLGRKWGDNVDEYGILRMKSRIS